MIEITAIKDGIVVERRFCDDLKSSEKQFDEMLTAHRDCEVSLGDPNANSPKITLGPRRR